MSPAVPRAWYVLYTGKESAFVSTPDEFFVRSGTTMALSKSTNPRKLMTLVLESYLSYALANVELVLSLLPTIDLL
jgi:hypothetical protein